MLLKEFPDIHWLKKSIQQNFSAKRSWDNRQLPNSGWPTAILNVKADKAERQDIKGPFSLFLNISGTSEVTCDQKDITVHSDIYVLSNHGQHYDLKINSVKNIETYNIHFGEKLYRDTIHSFVHSDQELLEDILPTDIEYNIPIKTNFRSRRFNMLIEQVRCNYDGLESEEHLHELLGYLLVENRKHFTFIKSVSALRKSTKEELIRRVYLAVDFIHSHYNEVLTLEDLSQMAMLSKFHFLRTFKSIFELTPHQYIKNVRLEKALMLLKTTDFPLYLIAEKVGIENGSSLSRMIYQQTGLRPSIIVN